MKALKPLLIFSVAICCFTACKKEVDMTLVQKTVLENADIRQIIVGDAWEVTVIADSNTYVELEYSAYLEDYIKAKLEAENLEIGFTTRVNPVVNSVFCARVHTPQLEQLEVSGAANVQFQGEFSGNSLTVRLDEVSKCQGLAFSGENCEIRLENTSLLTGFHFVGDQFSGKLENESQFNGEIQASDRLDLELEGASRFFVNKGGETAFSSIKMQNASRLNMVETLVDLMEVELSSKSEATVRVSVLLKGTLKEESTLNYMGHPQLQIESSEDSFVVPL